MVNRGSLRAVSSQLFNKDGGRRDRKCTGNNNMLLLIFAACIVNSIATILIYEAVTSRMDSVRDTGDFSHEQMVSERIALGQKKAPRLPQTTTTTATKTFTPCPEEFCKLVYFFKNSSSKLYEPLYRAFHDRGYSRTKDVERAHFLWTDQPWQAGDFFKTLKPWQRYNYFPGTDKWDDKDKMALTMNNYYSESGIEHLHSFPESYVLHLPNGLEAFQKRLSEENGGMNVPWVLKQPTINKGQGVVILPQQSDELKGIIDLVKESNRKFQGSEKGRLVVQNYICDEMSYVGRKFDVRVFWAVASVDPLIVFFHMEQNYVRIGHAVYDESKLRKSNNKDHLTTHTFGAAESKATWDEFRELIENHVFGSESNFRDRFSREGSSNSSRETIEAILSDPFLHVQNQMKTVIGHLVNAYKNITFHPHKMSAENGFSWHAADMIIDNNLDVYIIEGTDGPGKDEDYEFRIKMHSELFGSLVDIVEEVTSLQEEGRPLDVSAMKKQGVLGGYEVVYNDGWFMDYRYQRLPKRVCLGDGINNNATPNGKGMEAKALLPTREVVPATFTALPKNVDGNSNTFWMQSRTSQEFEPVARSLRRIGWTPVDAPEDAQLIYHTEKYEDSSQSWQFVSQFPSQFSFFEDDHYLKYLDSSGDNGNVCRPIMHKNRPLKIRVYWLVLSLDPLIVLFHDGYLYFKYSRLDENEFLNLPKQDGTTETIWKGSWKALEHYLNVAHVNVVSSGKSEAAAAAADLSLNPMSHVRNQMKTSLVKIAQGFAKHAMEQNVEQGKYSSIALFTAKFQVDRNLNVFAYGAQHSVVKGEDYMEIVSLHDDLYGSTFRLLKSLNSTSGEMLNGEDLQDDRILGNYEWLIRPDADAPKTETRKFHYDWNHKAKECFE